MISSYFIWPAGEAIPGEAPAFWLALSAFWASLASFIRKIGAVAATIGRKAFCFCTLSLCITANGSVQTPRRVNVVKGMTAHQGKPVNVWMCSTDSVRTVMTAVGSKEKSRFWILRAGETNPWFLGMLLRPNGRVNRSILEAVGAGDGENQSVCTAQPRSSAQNGSYLLGNPSKEGVTMKRQMEEFNSK